MNYYAPEEISKLKNMSDFLQKQTDLVMLPKLFAGMKEFTNSGLERAFWDRVHGSFNKSDSTLLHGILFEFPLVDVPLYLYTQDLESVCLVARWRLAIGR